MFEMSGTLVSPNQPAAVVAAAGQASRKAAGSQLPKDVMGRIMGATAGNPIGMADYNRIAG